MVHHVKRLSGVVQFELGLFHVVMVAVLCNFACHIRERRNNKNSKGCKQRRETLCSHMVTGSQIK